jgi:hypothetical protein
MWLGLRSVVSAAAAAPMLVAQEPRNSRGNLIGDP